MENNWAARHMFAAAASCSSYPSSTQQLVDPSLGGAHGHHITCLKLGKRQYYAGDHAAAAAAAAGAIKRDRQSSSSAAATHVIPTCQVEGCTKSLMDAKDYHRRHKVCEMHSKAPKVVVLGSEQRFCQQCSRFHAMSEFDDSKRSCRRRLAGHNERRRKSNSSDSTPSRNPIPTLETTMMGSRYPYLSHNSPGSAHTLLSSKDPPWTPVSSHSSSAALHELIAETRAALLAKQLLSNGSDMCYNNQSNIISFMAPHQNNQEVCTQLLSGRFHDSGSDNLTLDLMRSNNSTSFAWD